MLVAIERGRLTFDGYGNGGNFSGNTPCLDRRFGFPLTVEREAVRLLSRDAVFAREHFGGFAHDHVRERALKAVAIHRVDEREAAHLVAPPRVGGVDEI